jgi:hypothetical protein
MCKCGNTCDQTCLFYPGALGPRGLSAQGPTGPTGDTGTNGPAGRLLNPKQLAVFKWSSNQNSPETVFAIPGLPCTESGGCFDGANLWFPSDTGSFMYKFSILTKTGTTVALPGNTVCGCPVFDGEFIWCPVNATLTKIRASDNTIIATYTYPDLIANYSMCGCFDGTYLWFTTLSPTGAVFKINPVDGSLVATYLTGDALARSPFFDGTNLWIKHAGGTASLIKMDPNTGAILLSVPGLSPEGNLASDGFNLWSSGSFTTRINLTTNAITSFAINTAGSVMFDGIYIWGYNTDSGSVSKIDPDSGVVLQTTNSLAVPNTGSLLIFDSTHTWVRGVNAGISPGTFQMI